MLRIGSASTNSSTSKAINIRNDNERIGILKDPDGKYSLDISGSINCNALLIDGSIMTNSSSIWLTNDTDDNIYYDEGNVGIGMTTPTERLDVVGNIKLTGSLVTSTTTLTNTELNYLSGVTSNIQTQIDAAAASGVWVTTGNNIYYNTGNVGIGTNTPIEKLDVVGNIKLTGSLVTSTTTLTNTELNYLSGVTSNIQTQIDAAAASGVWVTTGNNIYYNTGNVGIGTVNPESALQVVGNIVGSTPTTKGIHIGMNNGLQANIELCSASTSYNSNIDFTVPNSDNKGRILYSHNENSMRFSTNNTEQMRITSNGNVGIGNTNPTHALDVNGSISASSDIYIGGSSGVQLNGSTNALTVNGTTTSTNFIATSDIRLKENIEKIENPLDKILKLSGYNYNFIKDDSKEKKAGLIAQHVEEYIPEAVHTKDETKSLDYNGIIPYLVECIKLQNDKINQLENKIENLINT